MLASNLVLLNLAISRSISRQFGALKCSGGARPYGSAITFGIGPGIGVNAGDITGGVNPMAIKAY